MGEGLEGGELSAESSGGEGFPAEDVEGLAAGGPLESGGSLPGSGEGWPSSLKEPFWIGTT